MILGGVVPVLLVALPEPPAQLSSARADQIVLVSAIDAEYAGRVTSRSSGTSLGK